MLHGVSVRVYGRLCAPRSVVAGMGDPAVPSQYEVELSLCVWSYIALSYVITFMSDVEVDVDRRNTTRKGQDVKLTPAEYNLLLYFMHNPDRALTRDVILNSVWGYESYPNSRTVDAHVVRLRQKLEPDPNIPRHFVTVHGVGYRFLP